jgi:hypothetical protein
MPPNIPQGSLLYISDNDDEDSFNQVSYFFR